ncbi:hypothetical protein J4683_24280, partial [Salmonella sp. 32020301-2015-00098-FB-01-SM-01]|uniref:hypothetical protein n=1 Tax=Salmonella sp. 32020301-2015-00098-FB-01-SM-01 TaxID=2819699 RepID=UPI001AAE66D2
MIQIVSSRESCRLIRRQRYFKKYRLNLLIGFNGFNLAVSTLPISLGRFGGLFLFQAPGIIRYVL